MFKLYIEKNTTTKKLLAKVLKENNIKEKVLYNEYGKPYLKSNKLYFNLSNCDDITVCATSDNNIGVDIERKRYSLRVIKKVCTKKESELIKNKDDFTKMWVKKESYVKYLGVGIGYGLQNVDTLNLKHIALTEFENYYIAVCYGE